MLHDHILHIAYFEMQCMSEILKNQNSSAKACGNHAYGWHRSRK